MLVPFCSTAGSPGVSGWSVLVAGMLGANADHDVVALEADASGGVMATRYGIGITPGAADLAIACAAAQSATTGGVDPTQFGRRVGERSWMVPTPVIPAEAAAVWSEANCSLVATALAADHRLWIVDVGRFGSSGWLWHEAATVTALLVPAWTDALVCAKSIVGELAATGSTRVLVVGKSVYRIDELSDFFGVEVGVLPRADVVAESVSVWNGRGRWTRNASWTAASALAADLNETAALAWGVA